MSSCSLNKRTRITTGLNLFFASARLKNIDQKKAYKLHIGGFDLDGEAVDEATYMDRATTIQDIFEAAGGATATV